MTDVILEGRKKTEQQLINFFRARFPFIYIPTWEESRVIDIITDIASDASKIKTQRDIFIWSSTEGVKKITEEGQENVNTGSEPIEALNFIENYSNPAIMILKDIHCFLGVKNRAADYNYIRKMRDVAISIKTEFVPKNIVIVAPTLLLPEELQKDVTVYEFDLPTLAELKTLLNDMIDGNEQVKTDLTEEEKDVLCKAALGLTSQEAENAFARAMIAKGQLTIKEIDIIMDEKCQVIKKTGILEFIKTPCNIDDVGGLENLKRWFKKRNNSWLAKAQTDYNLPAPKGVLITGVPGCGKSLTAKAISATWQLPLLRLDVGKIFSGLVGSSEENMRKAIQTAEAVSPSILWIDEIEKGFGGVGGENDGGTSTRVFGTFLTWLNEKTKPVFVIATANNINSIPPEMLRKGRFDEIFFVDLPTKKERYDIFKLHLKKMLKNSISESFCITDELLFKLAEMTEGFVGAEIEQVVVSALFEAFSEDRILLESDLFKVIQNTVPLSTTQAEQILGLRLWANERAVSATAKDVEYNYIPEETQEESETKEKAKKATETVKRARGGRTIDF